MTSHKNKQISTLIDSQSYFQQHHKHTNPPKRKLYRFNNQSTQKLTPDLQIISYPSPEEYEEFVFGQSDQLLNTNHTKQQKNLTRSLTSAKKKQKQISHEALCEQNIFKHPSSILSSNLTNNSIRLPALSKKNTIYAEMSDLNSIRRKKIKIPMQKLKPLAVDEVKRRFMQKYRKELVQI